MARGSNAMARGGPRGGRGGRRGMTKKGGQIQLQVELNTDEEWTKFIDREGLIVVDVFSEWCGPCIGMVGNLKKLKLELGSDHLHYAVAKAEGITVLNRFKDRSEPTWMLVAGGRLIKIMMGTDAPRLMRLIQQELHKELKVMAGERERESLDFSEITEEERKQMEYEKRLQREQEEQEAKELAEKIRKAKLRSLKRLAQKLTSNSVIIFFPTVYSESLGCEPALKLLPLYEEASLSVVDQLPFQITKDNLDLVFYESGLELTDAFKKTLTSLECYVTLLQYQPVNPDPEAPPEKEEPLDLGVIEQKTVMVATGNGDCLNPAPKSIAQVYMNTTESGEKELALWTPTSPLSKAAIFQQVFPRRVEALGHVDEKLPPPSYIIIYEATKAPELMETIKENSDIVEKFGFFDSADPATAKLLCKTHEDLLLFGEDQILLSKLVIAMKDTKKDESILLFSQLFPIYISPDPTIGLKEREQFFPFDFDDWEGSVAELKRQRKIAEEQRLRAIREAEAAAAEAAAEEEAQGEGGQEGEGQPEGEGDAPEQKPEA
ncbi:unnamed protein product [Bemisia tabaci]|uniref:Thioredoxin domain-containing protein n=1 Tax=Bemisia tabaci TaxID=7038 RepID=A0A9P0F4T7_BEMTA|nr:unnamed protein product [Bemisia tabaci]